MDLPVWTLETAGIAVQGDAFTLSTGRLGFSLWERHARGKTECGGSDMLLFLFLHDCLALGIIYCRLL